MFMILNGTKLAVKVTGDRKLIAKVFVYILSIHAKLLSIVAKSALVDNFVDKALSIPALAGGDAKHVFFFISPW